MRLRPNSQLDSVAKNGSLVLRLFAGCGCLTVGPPRRPSAITKVQPRVVLCGPFQTHSFTQVSQRLSKDTSLAKTGSQGEETVNRRLFSAPLAQDLRSNLLSAGSLLGKRDCEEGPGLERR